MGVAIYVQGYKKKESSISGQIKCLDWYEVDKNEIQSDEIEGTSTVIHDGFSTIDYLLDKGSLSDFGIYDTSEITFYFHMPNGMSGANFRNEDGKSYEVMFGPEKLMEVIPKLVQCSEWAKGQTSIYFNAENAVVELKRLSEILEKIKNENGLISFFIG